MFDLLLTIINYNSQNILNIVYRLIDMIDKLSDNISLKLLIVDNNSSDNSFKKIVNYIIQNTKIDAEFIKLSKNYGFAPAVNLSYLYAKRRYKFKYFGIANNDLIIVPQNIPKIIEHLEYTNIGGVQGTIMQMLYPHLIDNAGFLIDRLGLSYPVCRNFPISCARQYPPSHLSGALSFYKLKAIEKIGKPFDNAIEAYYDDKYLGLMLWNKGFKLLHVPLVSSYHLGTYSYRDRESFSNIIKGKKWFKGIVLSDIIPSIKGRQRVTPILLLSNYSVISVISSLFTKSNYLKAFIEAYKLLKHYSLYRVKMENLYINLANLPHIRPHLRHPLKGINTSNLNIIYHEIK